MSIKRKIRLSLLGFTALTMVVVICVALYELSLMRTSVSTLSREHTELIQQQSESRVVDEIAQNNDTAINDRLDQLLSGTLVLLPAVVVMLLLTALLLSNWISLSITRPLRQLAKGAERIREGEFNYILNEDGDRETATLAKSINAMTAQLLQNIETVSRETAGRRNAELSLEHSRLQFQYVIDLIPGGVFRYTADEEERIDFVSANMLGLLGYGEKEFRDKFQNRFSMLIYQGDRERVLKETGDPNAQYQQSEFRIETKYEGLKWFSELGKRAADEYGREWVYVVLTDVNQRKCAELSRERQMVVLESIAALDGVCGVLNRAAVEERIREALSARPERGLLLLYDLDNFKSVNDTHGHISGDRLLKSVAEVLMDTFRTSDLVGRLGGDEFIVFMSGARPSSIVLDRLERTLLDIDGLKAKFDWEVSTSASLGVADVKTVGWDFKALYAAADQALYQAKSHGKNRLAVYGEKGM